MRDKIRVLIKELSLSLFVESPLFNLHPSPIPLLPVFSLDIVTNPKVHWGPNSPVFQSYGIQKCIYGRFLFHSVIWEILNLNLKFCF